MLALFEVGLAQAIHMALLVEETEVVGAANAVLVEPGECCYHRPAVRSFGSDDHVHELFKESGKAVWELVR